MYPVSTAFQTAVKSDNRAWKGKVIIDGITHESTLMNLTFEDKLIAEEGIFAIGQSVSNFIDLTLQGVTGNFDGKKVEPFIGLEVSLDTYEWIPLGTFYVDSVEQDYNSVELNCFDSMIQFNFTYNPIISFPTTITTVINDLCAMVGVTFLGTLPNIIISKPIGMTARDLVGHIAGLCGGNATFNRNNNLVIREFTNPNTDNDLSLDGSNYFTLRRGNGVYTIGKVTGFIDDTISFSTGAVTTDTKELIIRNPFLSQTLINDLGTKLIGLSYYPFTMEWRGDTSVETGDNVTIDEFNGTIFKSVILQNIINFNGGISAISSSPLEGSIKNEFGSATNVTGTRYTWFKYADDETGLNMSDSPTDKKYLGLAYNKTTIIESNNPLDYSWSLIQGIPLYTWTKYADDENGLNMSDDPEGKKFLGIATNKENPNESINPLDYTWSALYSDIQVGGVNLVSNTSVPQTKVGEGIVANNYYLSDKMTSGEHTVSFNYDVTLDGYVCISLGHEGVISPVATDLICQNITAGVGTYVATAHFPRVDENTLILYTGGTITVTDLKLERGNVATDWSLSQEDLDDRMGDIETSISTQNGVIDLKVSKGNLISEINASIEGITISAPRLDLSGYVTITALGQEGATIINGANIVTGSISAEQIEGGTLSGVILKVDTTATVGTTLFIGDTWQDQAEKEILFNGIAGSGAIRFDPSTLHMEIVAGNQVSYITSIVDFANAEIRNFRGTAVWG
jgi:hypothetical protein